VACPLHLCSQTCLLNSRSPPEAVNGYEKRINDLGINDPYGPNEDRWRVHYPHVPVSENQFRQAINRLGTEVEKADSKLLQMALQEPSKAECETLYVMNDGGMVPMRGKGQWNEVKLGVVFRAENHVSSRGKIRGQIIQSRYAAHLGEQEDFKPQLQAAIEVERRGATKEIVWIGDGAKGNWTLARELCPQATQILDFQHALEHAMTCEKALLGENSPQLPESKSEWETRLLSGNVDASVDVLMNQHLLAAVTLEQVTAVNDLVRYYRNNQSRMRYNEYLSRNLLIGSGPVESGHRHVIQKRMKLAGQHWGLTGGRRMARLRAAYRTAGPERFLKAIRWAYRETLKLSKAPPKPRKAYASNR
jgi:hypothetical protein